jgi:hypothetical protein
MKSKYQNKRKEKKKQTNFTLPIQNNAVLVSESRENDGEELWALLTSTSPGHTVIPHELILQIREAVDPTISFKIVAHVLKVRGTDIQEGNVTHEDLDKEFASLQA